jgi:hypothetical protein
LENIWEFAVGANPNCTESMAAASLLCDFLETRFRWQRLRCCFVYLGLALSGSGFAAVRRLGDELSMAAASLLFGFLETSFRSWGRAFDGSDFAAVRLDGNGFAAVRPLGDTLSMAAASLLCSFLETSFRWQRLRCCAASWSACSLVKTPDNFVLETSFRWQRLRCCAAS